LESPSHADFWLAESPIVELRARMILENSMSGIVVMGLICAAGISPSSAAFPMIQEKEWLGYFIGIENQSFRFGITPEGKTWIDVLSKKVT